MSENLLVITNGTALLPSGMLQLSDLWIRNGRIAEIVRPEERPSPPEATINARGAYVLPGLIDIHVHGIGYESPNAETLDEFARLEATRGATCFFPTLFGPPDKTIANLERHRRNTDELRRIPQIGGFRLESPYLARAGGGVSTDLAPISRELTNKLLRAGGGLIKIWDISPELPGALEAIHELSAQGVVCSLAHTQASIALARQAVDAGARLVTHLFDTFVLPNLDDPDPGVYSVGLVDYLLVEDRVACEIIGDGTHVHPLLVEKTFRCKTPLRTVFVTDGNFGAGLPNGDYELPNNWGIGRIQGPNNGVRLVDRAMGLAGSALTPLDSFRNALRLFKKDFRTASECCSGAPAQLLGLNKGKIAVGRDADLIMLDKELELTHTMVGGKMVYQK
jgi:N-acetylglucosamine-6-phosphate deacetylase